jgi:hypothetical protein
MAKAGSGKALFHMLFIIILFCIIGCSGDKSPANLGDDDNFVWDQCNWDQSKWE